MGPLIEENKLQFDEKKQQKLKSLKNIWKFMSLSPSSITSLRDCSAIYGYLKNKNKQKQQFQ